LKEGFFMTNEPTTHAINYYQAHFADLLDELIRFLEIPSISTSDKHASELEKAANFLIQKFEDIGFSDVRCFSTAGHPIVYAEKTVDTHKPTILIYGHYDVQPPDPIDLWENPPFEPQVIAEYLYARGASDMKGQVWAMISALQAIMGTTELPVNIKFLIEGEEEIGSPSLEDFLKQHQALLKCDIVINPDAGMLAPDKPTIIYALRGLAFFELRVYGPKADLHSGVFGGVVDNPANILSQLIAGMHDDQNRVTLPAFYDQVRETTKAERWQLEKIGQDETFYKAITGVQALGGDPSFLPIERIGSRPTLDVNGFYAGYIEPGAKTIIPAYAMAKISTRLVPDQDPDQIHQAMQAYLEKNVPPSIRWELDYLSGAPAYIAEDNAPGMDEFIEALRTTWGVEPLRKREGGSIPVATLMKTYLGVDSIITGFGLPDDQIHSPNERLHLPTHQKGVEALIRYFLSMGA
jgi:acetylornithine deacetylase/succinyl-diaminopimelate desuccinylase-like protein